MADGPACGEVADRFDVVIVGAGISGIDAAVNLRRRCPELSFVVLERRRSFGGTWDLFRYPGLRSDSSMFTFGFDFRPWTSARHIAAGADIKAYLRGAIEGEGVGGRIRYGHHVVRAAWSSAEGLWRLACEDGARVECRFLFGCAGYYDADAGHEPAFPGAETFVAAGGKMAHAQKWPEDLDVAGRRVVVIGSGATAVTLVPAIAGRAAHVTMLQRSPTYIVPLPSEDPEAAAMLQAGVAPEEFHESNRRRKAKEMEDLVKFAAAGGFTQDQINGHFISIMRAALPQKYMSDEEFRRHLTPRYNVWEQRLCIAADGDFFRALRRRQAAVATDEIECLDGRGIRLRSGGRLDADVVISATGLQLHRNPPMATMEVSIDGEPYVSSAHHVYKDCMLSDVPNFAFVRGYFQDSWTLKADLVCAYICRLLAHMRERGHVAVRPRLPPGGAEAVGPPPESRVSAGYILRSQHTFPAYGGGVWAPLAHYPSDRAFMESAPIADEVLEFVGPASGAAPRSRL